MKKFNKNFNPKAMGVFKKRNTMRNIMITLGLLLALSSCEDYFEPKLTNEMSYDQLLQDPNKVRGLITYAYRAIPSTYDAFGSDFLDCSTDNALANNLTGNMNRMIGVDGYWTAVSNPLNNWEARYNDLQHVNLFIEVGLDGTILYFKGDLERDEPYRQRLKGEAYFLRAWIHFDLLRRFGGVDENGQLMGIPLFTRTLGVDEEFNFTRNTYAECIDQIIEDLDVALSAGLPEKYDADNDDFGTTNIGRPTTVACRAFKSRVKLYAASPAFETGSYAEAAQAAKEVIDVIGTTLPDVYKVNNISAAYFNNDTNDELIMRRGNGNQNGNTNMEQSHFPPSHYGNGKCNPSQNLVDAFPASNGYPITMSESGYDEDSMYMDRDPRLKMTVIHNNQEFKGQIIETFEGGNNMPGAPGVTVENSTRTGYYLRKWVSSKASLVAGNTVNDYHYNALFRKAEMFLNFAEAANEAYGPDDASLGMSAREAIAEVRRRAGIAAGGTDDYLASISSKEDMRELIKNERRLELCFEGHRFYDLRRWKDALNEPVQGLMITKNADGSFTSERKTIVTPSYKDYMYYGPLPQNELLKSDGLIQNQGW